VRAPSVSSSSTGARPSPRMRSISEYSVPYRLPTYQTHSRKPPASTRRANSSSLRNQYSTPSRSPARCVRVVAETTLPTTGKRGTTNEMSVPLPAPDGPVTTKTGLIAGEEPNKLRPLPLRETADRLRLADAALVEEPRSLHSSELRHRHQDVEHFRGRHVLGRRVQDRL